MDTNEQFNQQRIKYRDSKIALLHDLKNKPADIFDEIVNDTDYSPIDEIHGEVSDYQLGFRSLSDIIDLIHKTRWHQFHKLFKRDYIFGSYLDFDNVDLDTQREFVAFYLTHLIK